MTHSRILDILAPQTLPTKKPYFVCLFVYSSRFCNVPHYFPRLLLIRSLLYLPATVVTVLDDAAERSANDTPAEDSGFC